MYALIKPALVGKFQQLGEITLIEKKVIFRFVIKTDTHANQPQDGDGGQEVQTPLIRNWNPVLNANLLSFLY